MSALNVFSGAENRAKPSLWAHRLACFSVVWIVVTSGGVFLNSTNIVQISLLFNVLLVAVQFATVGRGLYKNHLTGLVLFLLLSTFVALSVIANSDYQALLSYARILVVIAVAFGTSMLVSNRLLAIVFVKTVLFLALVSVVFFYSEFVDKNTGLFPVANFYETDYVNAFVYLFRDGLERRNLSIFIEPGLYQIYLNICLFLVINFSGEIKYKYFWVAVLLLALYSTNSTTGLILGVVIIAGQAFVHEANKNNIIFGFLRIFFVLLAVSAVLLSEFFVTNLEEKFQSDKQKSAITRLNSSLIDLEIMRDNPIFGGGFGNYQNSLDYYDSRGMVIDAATNTFSQLGANLGIPFLLIVIAYVVIYVKNLSISGVQKLILFVVYVVSFSTEPFVLYPIFYLPVFLSCRHFVNKRVTAQRLIFR